MWYIYEENVAVTTSTSS